jgi:hypothetical protein
MRLFSAGEIVKKLKKGTTRQILDLAEKGIIIPARETTGSGSARLYDSKNIFDICVCLALRGKLPPHGSSQEILKRVLRFLSTESMLESQFDVKNKDWIPLEYIIIDGDDGHNPDNYTIRGFMKSQMSDLQQGWAVKEVIDTPGHPKPMEFCVLLLNIAAIREYLAKVLS